MKYLNRIRKPVSIWIIVSMFNVLGMPLTTWAGSSNKMLVGNQEDTVFTDRERLKDQLNRQVVQEQLIQYGISQEEALARIDALTDDEVATWAVEMDRVPAGGDGTVVGGVLLIIAFFAGVHLLVAILTSSFRASQDPVLESDETGDEEDDFIYGTEDGY